MKKRVLPIILSLILMALPLLAACSAPSPAPGPAPRQPYEINIGAGPTGLASYVLAFAFAEIINKNHPWIRATAQETTGSGEEIKLLMGDPAARKNWLIWSGDISIYQAKMGLAPFEGKYRILHVAQAFLSVNPIFTLDPNIKTVEDLVGKRMSIGAVGSGFHFNMRFLLGDVYNILDKIKVSNLPLAASLNGLVDGTLDAAVAGGIGVVPNIGAPPAQADLMAAKKVYSVDFDIERVEKLRQEKGLPNKPYQIKGGAMDGFKVMTSYVYWHASPEMPDEVVYELAKVLYEHYAEFANYYALTKAWTPEIFAKSPAPEGDWHPGAIKFYKEKGLTVGKG